MLIDFFWPRECFVCGSSGTNLCKKCEKTLPAARLKCLCCSGKNPFGIYCRGCRRRYLPEKALACFEYEGYLKDAIHQFKYDDTTDLASTFGRAISREIKSIPDYRDFTLVPVPVSPKKMRSRGYNQAELLAAEVAKILDLKLSNLLVRVIQTVSQVDMTSKQARKYNVKGAFVISKFEDMPREVILIDDTITTGATVEEATKVLRRSGVKKVLVVALALGGF
jgi:competence protein ComFC